MKLNVKNILFVIIIIILVELIIIGLTTKENFSNQKNLFTQTVVPTQVENIPHVKKADKIEVLNFHRTQRCISCTTLGKLSEQTVKEKFANEVASGKVVFKSVNIDLPENEEITKLYQASGSSLYINAVKDGKNNIAQNMKVWQYLSDEEAFITYLEAQLKTLL